MPAGLAHRRGAVAVAAVALAVSAAPAASAATPKPHAAGIQHASNLAFDPQGRLWAVAAGQGPTASDGVWFVRRRGAAPVQVVPGLESALGLAWHRGWLYVSHITASGGGGLAGRITAYRGFDGRRFTRSRVVVDGLPVGRHRIDSIAPGPGGRLYLGIGSEFDNRASNARLSSTVVSFRPSGRGLRIEATGLRNPYGLGFIPGTSQLLVSEHGRDDLGLRSPNEEVNAFDVDGRAPDFGFPACYGQGGSACRGTRAPLVRLPPHAAPGAVAVVKRSSGVATAYVPQFGSSFDANPTGGDIVAIGLTRKGGRWRASRRTFAAGLGRQNPLGAAIGPDGDLYVSLWSAGRIVRFDLPRPKRVAVAAERPREAAGASGPAPRPRRAASATLTAPLETFLRRIGWVLGRLAA